MLGARACRGGGCRVLDQLSKLLVLDYFGETGCASHRDVVTSFLDLVV